MLRRLVRNTRRRGGKEVKSSKKCQETAVFARVCAPFPPYRSGGYPALAHDFTYVGPVGALLHSVHSHLTDQPVSLSYFYPPANCWKKNDCPRVRITVGKKSCDEGPGEYLPRRNKPIRRSAICSPEAAGTIRNSLPGTVRISTTSTLTPPVTFSSCKTSSSGNLFPCQNGSPELFGPFFCLTE